MLDAKNCTTKDITKLLIKCNNFVDLIRIATDPKRIEHSLEIAKSLKSLGFEVAVNIIRKTVMSN
jgi:4-hydroxy 2-oxovalerate aldolase